MILQIKKMSKTNARNNSRNGYSLTEHLISKFIFAVVLSNFKNNIKFLISIALLINIKIGVIIKLQHLCWHQIRSFLI